MHSRLRSPLLLMAIAVMSAHPQARTQKPYTLRVGFFPNITHSQALFGMRSGEFAAALGENVKIDAKAFNAGPSVIEALFAGQIDISYIGPNPAINGYVKSGGEALRVIAGVTSGGAALIVRPDAGIRSAPDFSGKNIATPQLGNTQDVALRDYLKAHNLLPKEKGGTVNVMPMENPTILSAFRQGLIQGAWVPEPWASRLEVEGGGAMFLDERTLWKDGEFCTALIIASTKILKERPDAVKAWLRAHVKVTLQEREDRGNTLQAVNDEIRRMTGTDLPMNVLERAWSRMKPTYDPLAPTLQRSADSAFAAGFLKSRPDLSGLVDLRLLNEVLAESGLPPVR